MTTSYSGSRVILIVFFQAAQQSSDVIIVRPLGVRET
jgi:hypothetical protein